MQGNDQEMPTRFYFTTNDPYGPGGGFLSVSGFDPTGSTCADPNTGLQVAWTAPGAIHVAGIPSGSACPLDAANGGGCGLVNAVLNGTMPLSVFKQSLARILYQEERFGLLGRSDNPPSPLCTNPGGSGTSGGNKPGTGTRTGTVPLPDGPTGGIPVVGTKNGDAAIVEKYSEMGATLLKNDGQTLPLTSADLAGGVLVTGANANHTVADPTNEALLGFIDRNAVNPLQQLKALSGNPEAFTFVPANDPTGMPVPSSALSTVSGSVTGALARTTGPGSPKNDSVIDFTTVSGNGQLAPGSYTWEGYVYVPTSDTYTFRFESSASVPTANVTFSFDGTPSNTLIDAEQIYGASVPGTPTNAGYTEPLLNNRKCALDTDTQPGPFCFPGQPCPPGPPYPNPCTSALASSTYHAVKITFNNDPSTVVINAHGFPYLDSTLPIADRVADLMSRMSLFDKVGQMTQTNMSVLQNGATTNNSSYNNIRAWRIGSVLSGGSDNPTPNSPTGWAHMVDAFQYRALATPLQIPHVYGEDTIHGNAHMVGAVMFSHDIGMGATHNPDLSYQQGVITAQETRSAGPHWGFGPTICAARDIRWGRTYECYSEDPDLVNLMETIIDGYQGPDPMDMSGMHIVTSSKHFAGDGATQNGRNAGIDVMSSEEFARVALAPYIPAVQQHHTGTIMPSYSSTQLDGAPTSILMSANADLMTGWLKNTIGFDGFLISDWDAINSIPVPSPNPLPSPINQSYAYQIMISFNAGMDMVMAPSQPEYKNFVNYLQTLVAMGYVAQSRIDDAVKRILTQKFALGLFEQPFTDRSTQDQIYSPEHKAVARQATAESQVLLKNSNNILPLSKTANIYLAGSNADNIISQAGGWSISWQSIPTNMVPAVAPFFTTIRQALQNVVGTGNVTYDVDALPAPLAGAYDVGIVVVGETAYAEGSGDVPTAKTNTTTTADATAINNVCGVMPCIILSMAGRPFWLTDAQFDAAEAVVATWLPGSEGDGVADVVFGDVDFTGRLSTTWSRSAAQEPINVGDATYDPRYPFGWGLRSGSSKARLQQTRESLAGIAGEAHVDAAIAYLDQLLATDVWDANGAASDPGCALRLLHRAAGELSQTDADAFLQYDGVVSAARDIAQAAVVAAGGPSVATSSLFADANHEVLINHPDVAVELLARALPPIVSADPASQTVQYSDRVQTVTISAGNAASELPLSASTEWSLDGGAFQPGLPDWLAWAELPCTADDIWSECTWTLDGVGTVPVSAGTYVVMTTVTEGAQSSSVVVTIVVAQEDAYIEYTGETIAEINKELALRATVWDSAAEGYAGANPESAPDATLGDITKMWIAFDLSDCISGAPLATQYAQVVESGLRGIGTASSAYSTGTEGFLCVNARLVAGPAGGVNGWYAADSGQAVLTFYEPSG